MKLCRAITIILFAFLNLVGCANLEANSAIRKPNEELVVLAHGLGRSDWAMWQLAKRLESANYKVCLLNYATIGKSVDAVIKETTKQIDACIVNTSKVHFVGHSLGGLVIRAYLQPNKQRLEKLSIGNVVLMGTPNKGSELADHLSNSWLMNVGGGVSRALVTGINSFGNNLDEIDVNIGVIAGTKTSAITKNQFNGPNDGLVSVESTKLNSMSDFITIEMGHSEMRYNLETAEQTIYFLQKGTFKH